MLHSLISLVQGAQQGCVLGLEGYDEDAALQAALEATALEHALLDSARPGAPAVSPSMYCQPHRLVMSTYCSRLLRRCCVATHQQREIRA